jgi:hypothetical protein
LEQWLKGILPGVNGVSSKSFEDFGPIAANPTIAKEKKKKYFIEA